MVLLPRERLGERSVHRRQTARNHDDQPGTVAFEQNACRHGPSAERSQRVSAHLERRTDEVCLDFDRLERPRWLTKYDSEGDEPAGD